jgi:hypothetical protein
MRLSRVAEDIGFLLATVIATVFVLAESAARIGLKVGECAYDSNFPWGLVVLVCALVLPKTLGRATAGKVWSFVGSRISGSKSNDLVEKP